MGLFTKPNKQDEKKEILVTTTEDIPGKKFEVLGLVTADIGRPASPNFKHVCQELQKEAEKLGADAIIGFRATAFRNSINWVSQAAYGTAIRFIKEGQDGE
jgi:uncharacterized protein YbjQ (UPF0145 family)